MSYTFRLSLTFCFVLSLGYSASAADFFLNLGESIHLGSNVVYCGQNTGLPSCQESCEHFDTAAGVCKYQSRCEIAGTCIIKTSCDKWNQFDQICQSEQTDYLCRNHFNCSENCEHFDSFKGVCLYKSKCELLPNSCFRKTTCERFDTFDSKCLSERRELNCP